MPGLIWNAMMSMSGGWFFVVASEAITVGNTTVTLPGIGSYVALAIAKQNLTAIGYALFAMLLVIIAYDQLLFRPIVAWADKFRFEQTASGEAPTSWMLDLFRRTRALRVVTYPFVALNRAVSNLHIEPPASLRPRAKHGSPSRFVDIIWFGLIAASTGYAGWRAYQYLSMNLGPSDVFGAIGYGLITLARVIVLIALATLIWVPVGVWIGFRPKLAAARAVSCGIPGQPRLPRLCLADRPLPSQPEYLAEPADDPGHAMVYPVQRDRGRERLSERPARGGLEFSPRRVALVGESRAAGHFSVLHHRRHHRLRRLLERFDRRGSGKLGQHTSVGRGVGRLYRQGD
jgi:hypothetical protein